MNDPTEPDDLRGEVADSALEQVTGGGYEYDPAAYFPVDPIHLQ